MTTPPSLRPSRGPIRFEGVLKKQEPKAGGGAGVAWTSRYFVLNDNKLQFWRIKDTSIVERDVHPEVVTTGSPIGQYDLGITEVSLSDQRDGNCFELFPQGDPSVLLLAPSKEECASWIQAIRKSKQRAIDNMSGNVSTSSMDTPLHPRNLSESLTSATNARGGSPPRSVISQQQSTASPAISESSDRTVNQLRVQLRESQLRHEATLEANKKALASVGTKHYQEKQALLEKIAALEGRLGDTGTGTALADTEMQMAQLRGELAAERAKCQDALLKLESTSGRLQSMQADMEGAKALLVVEKRRTAELQDQLDAAARRNTELQIELERTRVGGQSFRSGGGRETEHLQMLVTELQSKISGLERTLHTTEQRNDDLSREADRLRTQNLALQNQMQEVRADLEDKLKSAIESANAANQEVGELHAQLEVEKMKSENTSREADKKIRDAVIMQSSVENQTHVDRIRLTDLTNRLNALENDLKVAQRDAEERRRENESLKEQLRQAREDLTDERSRSISSLKGLEDDRSRNEDERRTLAQKVQEYAGMLEQLNSDRARAEMARDEAEQLLQDQRLVNKALRGRLDEVTEELKEGRDMLGEAEKRVAAAVLNATREVEAERVKTEELEGALLEASRTVQHKEIRLGELERSLHDRRAQQEAMTQHFDQLVEGLRADASAAIARATAAEQRANNAEHELEQLMSSRSATDRMSSQYAKQVRDLQAEVAEVSDEREKLNQRIRDLQKRYDMSTSLVDQYKRTNDRQAREIEDLKYELENTLAGRSRSSNGGVNTSSGLRSSLKGSSRRGDELGSLPVVYPDEMLRRRDLEAEAKYAELVRASDSLVEEMTRDKNLLLERIRQLEEQNASVKAQADLFKRENAELAERNERDQALALHLRRQLEERDIQLDDKSRQILEATMIKQNGLSQRNADYHILEQELFAIRNERERLHSQIEKQQSLLDAKDAAIARERKVMQDTIQVERTQRQQLEDENGRLRQLSTTTSGAYSPYQATDAERIRYQQQIQSLEAQLKTRDESHQAEIMSLKAMLQDEQQQRLRLDQQLRTLNTPSGSSGLNTAQLERQLATVTQERDAALQRVQALKQTLVSKQLDYQQQIDDLQNQLNAYRSQTGLR